MRLTIFALALALTLPIYGQGEKPNTPSNKQPTKNEQQPQSQPSPAASTVGAKAINQEVPQSQDNRATGHPKGYLSRLFSPENLPTIGLVILGVFGLGYAWKTLRAVEQQGQAILASERAWISIKSDMEHFNASAAPSRFYWRAINTGKSVAKLVSTDARFLVWNGYDPLSNIPQFENTEIRLNGRILAPGESYQFHGYFEDWQNGAYSRHDMNIRLDSMPPDTLFLLMYGRIRYETMGKDCESNFVEDYTWVKSRPQPFEGFRTKLEAPAAYSKHT